MALDSSSMGDRDVIQAGPDDPNQKRAEPVDSDRFYIVDDNSSVLVRAGDYVPGHLVGLPHVAAILTESGYVPDPKATVKATATRTRT